MQLLRARVPSPLGMRSLRFRRSSTLERSHQSLAHACCGCRYNSPHAPPQRQGLGQSLQRALAADGMLDAAAVVAEPLAVGFRWTGVDNPVHVDIGPRRSKLAEVQKRLRGP